MKINLYLDDKRDCPEGFVIARTMDEAIELMKTHKVHILSLDHDLGEDKNKELLPTGYDFVKYFCGNGLYADKIYIHTYNPRGREDMYETLKGAQRRGFISSDIYISSKEAVPGKYSDSEEHQWEDL